jgi:hypothetical protein
MEESFVGISNNSFEILSKEIDIFDKIVKKYICNNSNSYENSVFLLAIFLVLYSIKLVFNIFSKKYGSRAKHSSIV